MARSLRRSSSPPSPPRASAAPGGAARSRPATVVALALAAALAPGCGSSYSPGTCTADSELQEIWSIAQSAYLYQSLLPTTLDPTSYATPTGLVDAITAGAAAAGKDRSWSYVTTTAAASQFFGQGQAIGFGLGLLTQGTQLLVDQVIPGAPAAGAGFLRGDQILAIGPDPTTLVPVSTLIAAGTVDAALPGEVAGQSRSFQVQPASGPIVVRTVTTALYDIVPVETTWVSNGVGYVSLRAFVSTAEPALATAFAAFAAATPPVTELILDLRYDGGGQVSTAAYLADLIGAGQPGVSSPAKLATRPAFQLQFDAALSSMDQTATFVSQVQSLPTPPSRLAIIASDATASASELVTAALDPYLTVEIVGSRTYGKPVGQAGFDLSPCGDELFLVAFQDVNSAGFTGWYGGLPPAVADPSFRAQLCPAADDLAHAPGDLAEASTAAALAWLQTGACTPAASPLALTAARPAVGYPGTRSTPAREALPGVY